MIHCFMANTKHIKSTNSYCFPWSFSWANTTLNEAQTAVILFIQTMRYCYLAEVYLPQSVIITILYRIVFFRFFFLKKCDKNKVLYFDNFFLIFPFEPESFNQLNSYWTVIFDHAFDLIFNILIESTIKLADNLRNQLSITIALFSDCVCW